MHIPEGVILPTNPRWWLRALREGLIVGDCPVPRRWVLRTGLRLLRIHFDWWAALPGDAFYDMPRDRWVIVRGGIGRSRTFDSYSGQAVAAGRAPRVRRGRPLPTGAAAPSPSAAR